MSRALGLPAAALLAAAAIASGEAGAYTRAESNWNPGSLPIPYRINLASAPASIGPDGARSAIEAGMASWAAPTCTRWRAVNAGTTAVTRGNSRDRENSFLWISGSWPAELGDVRSTIGVTTPVWTVGGYFIDADIQFNNVGFRWSLNGAAGTVDTQSIATHEEGHFLGLDHSSSSAAVMYASYSGGLKRTLTSDDIAGVCAIYPSGGPVPDAGTPPPPTDRCAALTSCGGCTPYDGCGWCGASGRCMSGTASGPTGATCSGGWVWLPSDCSSTPPPDPCSRNTTCGTCTPVDGCGWCSASNRCMSGTQTGPTGATCGGGWAWVPMNCPAGSSGTSAFGEPCTQPSDCASGGVCVSNGTSAFCSRSCADDCTCPRGYQCVPTRTADLSVCAPGPNTCGASSMDSGVPPVMDAGTTVWDAGLPPDPMVEVDAGEASDVAAPEDTGAPDARRRTGTYTNPGCACTVPAQAPRRGSLRLAALAVAVALVARVRRRRE
jgi:MYXO-CTERM domain-containing protein